MTKYLKYISKLLWAILSYLWLIIFYRKTLGSYFIELCRIKPYIGNSQILELFSRFFLLTFAGYETSRYICSWV